MLENQAARRHVGSTPTGLRASGLASAVATDAGGIVELNSMENDALKVADFGRILQGITDGQEIIPEFVPGIYRMVVEIIECADSLIKTHERLQHLVAPLRKTP